MIKSHAEAGQAQRDFERSSLAEYAGDPATWPLPHESTSVPAWHGGESFPGGRSGTVLPEMGWDEIREAGCYVHLASGHLARVFPEELGSSNLTRTYAGRILVAKLADDPETALSTLRTIARRHDYPVSF